MVIYLSTANATLLTALIVVWIPVILDHLFDRDDDY